MITVVGVITKQQNTNNNDKLLFLFWNFRQSDIGERTQDLWWVWSTGTLKVKGRAGSPSLWTRRVLHMDILLCLLNRYSLLILHFSFQKPLTPGSLSWPWLEWMPFLCGLITWSTFLLQYCQYAWCLPQVPENSEGRGPFCFSLIYYYVLGMFFLFKLSEWCVKIGAVDLSHAREGSLSFRFAHEFPLSWFALF